MHINSSVEAPTYYLVSDDGKKYATGTYEQCENTAYYLGLIKIDQFTFRYFNKKYYIRLAQNNAEEFITNIARALSVDNYIYVLKTYSKNPNVKSKILIMGTYDECKRHGLSKGYELAHRYLFVNYKSKEQLIIETLNQKPNMDAQGDYVLKKFDKTGKESIISSGSFEECKISAELLENVTRSITDKYSYNSNEIDYVIVYIGKNKQEVIDYYRQNIGELYIDENSKYMIYKDNFNYAKATYEKIANIVGEHVTKHDLLHKIKNNNCKIETVNFEFNGKEVIITEKSTGKIVKIQSNEFSIIDGVIKLKNNEQT